MKKIMYIIILIVFLIYILAFPTDAVAAAAFGLQLWFQKMLPTLLPFSILSFIVIHSGMLDQLTKKLHRVVKHVFPVSSAGLFPLIAGLLFGFPMGSKITAELVENGKMSYQEGQQLFCICNNISPMFVSSFILSDSLNRPDLTGYTYLILYAPPLILYMISNYKKKFPCCLEKNEKKSASMNFQLIDAGIMNGFETLAKLGGYIMLFAILAQMTTLLPIKNLYLRCILIGCTEITNGISYTAHAGLRFSAAYPLMMAYAAFGGLSGFAQTASMVKNTGFSLKPYLRMKIFGTCITFLLALWLVQ